jgi:predicted RNA binding protein YcfA (HicA-like mRNA interferase family)
MSKLPKVNGREAFTKAGFSVARTTGSHHIMKKDGHRNVLSVPVHASTDLKPGTLRSLIKASGLTVDEFLRLMNGKTKGRMRSARSRAQTKFATNPQSHFHVRKRPDDLLAAVTIRA